MSRSYKYSVHKDEADRVYKKLANKKNRQWLKTLDKGFKSSRLFKILVNPWDISDWKFMPKDNEDKQKARRK